ncbi:MAG: hypothetical protein HDS25_00960 [Bacteroides sp.]|nr:hypothetical protein [Bacteroides sp.]
METDLYRAIEEMKRISASGATFSLKFRKYNRDNGKGGDLVHLAAARLRPKASDEEISNASYKLFLTDTETGRALNCWELLVVEFNGRKTVLN